MSQQRVIHGEVYLTLETVAECYEVEVTWVREVYDVGLLGTGEPVEHSIAIAARMLDRLAEVRRLTLQTGVNLPGIVMLLERRGRD